MDFNKGLQWLCFLQQDIMELKGAAFQIYKNSSVLNKGSSEKTYKNNKVTASVLGKLLWNIDNMCWAFGEISTENVY